MLQIDLYKLVRNDHSDGKRDVCCWIPVEERLEIQHYFKIDTHRKYVRVHHSRECAQPTQNFVDRKFHGMFVM